MVSKLPLHRVQIMLTPAPVFLTKPWENKLLLSGFALHFVRMCFHTFWERESFETLTYLSEVLHALCDSTGCLTALTGPLFVDDFVTADVAAGTGGLDASIGFETHRPENVGRAFNDSLFVFAFFINAKASSRNHPYHKHAEFSDQGAVADLIALGAALSIGACGGPAIPLRTGRIDATEASTSIICRPETDLETTLASFSSAGFNQADTIALTACGHTMGG